MCPFPQSTAWEKSLVMFGSMIPRKDGDKGLSDSGNLTARPQPGYGHHLMEGLLSTNAWRNNDIISKNPKNGLSWYFMSHLIHHFEENLLIFYDTLG